MNNQQKTPNKILSKILKQISKLGSYQFFIILIFIFYITNQLPETIFLCTAFFTTSLIAIPIRLFFFKERPNKIKYKNIIGKFDAASFPSMHSTRIIILLLFFIKYYINMLWATITLSLLTFLVLYARFYNKSHYLIDILAGIIFGFITYIILTCLL